MSVLVPVPGGQVRAWDSGGDGPALILLHSGWGDSSIWGPMLDRLPARYRAIRYDQRGYGRSPAPQSPYAQLDDLVAVLDWHGVGEALVAGYSGGGGPAAGLALASPGRVRGLMLLAPGVQDYPWPADDPYMAEFGALFTAGDRAGLTSLGLRTWRPREPMKPSGFRCTEQLRHFFASASSSGLIRPSTTGWSGSGCLRSWSPGTGTTRW